MGSFLCDQYIPPISPPAGGARIDEIVKKMPKRLLRAFPTLSSKKNPDSVPLARESLEKDGRAGKGDAPAERKGEKDDPGT